VAVLDHAVEPTTMRGAPVVWQGGGSFACVAMDIRGAPCWSR
jgi:hypothetical protein